MANYNNLKTAIQQVIYENGNQEITGSVMQATLLAMVNSLGAGYQFIGIATPSMNPGTPDQNVFYLAATAGTYVNFGNIVLDENEFAILKYNGSWTKEVTGLASAEKVDHLSKELDGYEGEIKVVKDVSSISYVSRYIKASNNTWNSGNSSRGKFIPVTPGKKYGILYTNLNAQASAQVAVVRDASITIGASVNYATGFGLQDVTLNNEYVFTAPEDAAYVFISIRYGSTTAFQYTVYEYDTYPVAGVVEKVADIQPKTDTLWEERNAEQVPFVVDMHSWSSDVIESGITYRNSYYLMVATGKWNSGSAYLSTRFPVFNARRVRFTPGAAGYAYVAFLKNASYSLNAIASFCDGYDGVISITSARDFTIPPDCQYIYVENKNNNTNINPDVTLYYDKTDAVMRRRPIVSFIDDDAQKAQMQWLEPVVEQTGIPLSIALITTAVGSTSYCTWDELRRWRNMGFNFVAHGATPITEIDPADLPARFSAIQSAMEAHGMLDSNIFILPNGAWNAASKAIVAQYFEAAFNTTPRVNAPPISDRYLLRRITLDGGAGSLQIWKDWVDFTIQTHGWCIFYGHARGDVYTEEMRTAYIELINYCKGKGVDILSIPDGWKYYKQFI